ncbi:carbon monoxide dehydrogenase subunit CoxG protein (plasmid) [Rhizobium etli 8C-3]|uniref:Carbon monoxide dehydrogenase subunit CoxG protein n=1 Tax=Rhizobium etli 8C-3 TaxID=538025 RepID=A0A1L5PA76_RHIET|nr:carbon monoxide dehydrogenase subunit G [Rhizobium etli]APO77071.1 carbon monoxide dehydrogenase subunit CoxG protein [Rhizobium etli 8C-3]
MEMNGSQHIQAAQAIVWKALLDPAVLKDCVPGCQELTGTTETGFEATVVQRVGPVKATFKGTVTLDQLNEPVGLVLQGEGKGGAAGFAKGNARVTLTPSEEGTVLVYQVEAHIGGKLAQLGSRLIDGFAKKMADDFFQRFKTAVENRPVEA